MAGTGNRHNRTRQAGRRQQIRPPHHRHGHAASSRAYCSSISRSPNFRKSAGQKSRNEIWVAAKRQEKETQNIITSPIADLLLQEDTCPDYRWISLADFWPDFANKYKDDATHHRHGHAASSRAYCSGISRSPNFRKSAGQKARNEIWVAAKRQEKETQNLITSPVADLLPLEDTCRDYRWISLADFWPDFANNYKDDAIPEHESTSDYESASDQVFDCAWDTARLEQLAVDCLLFMGQHDI